jgi:hypothetical protein
MHLNILKNRDLIAYTVYMQTTGAADRYLAQPAGLLALLLYLHRFDQKIFQ